MNFRKWTTALILILTVTSCIRDEALNPETVIDACTGADIQLAHINNDSKEINIYMYRGMDLSKQQLLFILSIGAILSADRHYPNDILNNYDSSNDSHSRTFTATSEDGEWTTTYTVKIMPAEISGIFRFEDLLSAAGTRYDILYEFQSDTSTSISNALQWSSDNPGYELTSMTNSRTGYPTQWITEGFRGKGLRLATCDTGNFGAMVKMYIAAGNLFIGSFDLANVFRDPLRTTRLGIQYYKRPVPLKGYLEFKAGDVCTDKGTVQEDEKDRFDIYVIMYEANESPFMPNGNNSLDLIFNKLISIVRISKEDTKETDSWTPFGLPFKAMNGKSIDPVRLQEGKYKLSIVLSFSVDGAYFKGVVGNTLYVGESELISENNWYSV